ncbi:MAG: NUDIX domain-containing protein [Nanoarchaeota archaeon]
MQTAGKHHRIKCPFTATDAIIAYNDGSKPGLVLIERKNFPYGLALPGGFAEYGLTFEENVIKEVMEETGLEFIIDNPEHPLCVHSSPQRDPRAHICSLTYVGKGTGVLRGRDDAKSAACYPIPAVISLLGRNVFAFPDHELALEEYLIQEGYLKNR